MTKLYEDFFDDNDDKLQTSLKGMTDEIDNPAGHQPAKLKT